MKNYDQIKMFGHLVEVVDEHTFLVKDKSGNEFQIRIDDEGVNIVNLTIKKVGLNDLSQIISYDIQNDGHFFIHCIRLKNNAEFKFWLTQDGQIGRLQGRNVKCSIVNVGEIIIDSES